ncbi:hypothetical protein D3C72_1383500 [compost metagenome]
MTLGNGQDRTTEHFRGIGAEAQAQGDDTSGEGIELKAGNIQGFAKPVHQADGAKVNQQHPEQFGHATNQCGVEATQPSQGFVRRSLGQGAKQPQYQPQT